MPKERRAFEARQTTKMTKLREADLRLEVALRDQQATPSATQDRKQVRVAAIASLSARTVCLTWPLHLVWAS